MAACVVSIRLGLKGPLSAPCMACSTGAVAIGDAFRIIQRGDADIMLAGGSEASITPLAYGGFCANHSMSRRNDCPEKASRPFDKDRDGFVMGEGAGIVVLENLERARARGRQDLCRARRLRERRRSLPFHGAGARRPGDGPGDEEGAGDAGLKPGEIGYINAHGTSTVLNDKIESAAIIETFGDHSRVLKVSSIKSMIGHLLAAAGAVEFISTVMSLHTGIIPPTINYETPDPECPLDYTTRGAERLELRAALSNSFGFGGGNACLAVKKYRSET